MNDYICYICGKTTQEPHTDHDGNDVCAECCSVCKNERIADAVRAAYYAIRHMYINENVLSPDEDEPLFHRGALEERTRCSRTYRGYSTIRSVPMSGS